MDGINLIAAERRRQIEQEGYSTEHDDKHTYGEIPRAAQVYAGAARHLVLGGSPEGYLKWSGVLNNWPWDVAALKIPDDPIRNLVKAGALIAAEIDRLQRKAR